MNALSVWVERSLVLIANIGLNIGFITTNQEEAIAGGGIIAILTIVQIVLAVITHKKSLTVKV